IYGEPLGIVLGNKRQTNTGHEWNRKKEH
ncbi:hypothetical protein A2U01_0066194, partial [Trifolium medium]|nr:hypothetical protein [Trifolium medium]